MQFKIWLEAVISHDTARTFVLDAIGAGVTEPDEQSDLLGSQIGLYTDLADKLTAYSELQPYASEISGYVHASSKKSIRDLINFIADLDNKKQQEPQQSNSVGVGGLPAAPEPNEEMPTGMGEANQQTAWQLQPNKKLRL